jgi:Formyl transferase/ACT domain
MTAGIDLHPTRPMSFEPLDTGPDQDVGRLLVTCEDRPGICAAICGYLAGHGANITNLQQYTTDPSGGRLFVRIEFLLRGLDEREPDLSAGFLPLADSLGMDWRLARAAALKRLAIMVSKTDHALQELLWRRKAGDLHAEIAMVISNHEDLRPVVETWGIPYHYVPVTPETKPAAEEKQLDLLRGQVDAVVLARYMQVLSPAFLAAFQHPPQLPAGVRRRRPVREGGRARGQADRGDRALRDRRAGRRADHRAGRGAHRPPPVRHRPAPRRPVRRAGGARACGRLARGGPGDRARQQDHRVQLTPTIGG